MIEVNKRLQLLGLNAETHRISQIIILIPSPSHLPPSFQQKSGHMLIQCHIIIPNLMQLLSSMLSIVKSVTDTDREFKLLREKLVFSLKKGDAALNKYNKQHHVQSWVAEHLQRRLKDGREKLASLDKLLSNSQDQGISLKDKFKLSLPFNNQRDKINQTIDDLKTAIEEVLNNNIPMDPASASKRKLQPPPKELEVDSDIDELYEMGPTIQENNALEFAQEFTKNHTIELQVDAIGSEPVVKSLDKSNKTVRMEHTCERASKEGSVELFKLGRKNFKPEYKTLKQVYPDIDKISKEVHFTIKWIRVFTNDRSQLSEVSNRKLEKGQASQKKEEAEQFFSVPDQQHLQPQNGQVILEKEKRSLYRKVGEAWVRIEEEWFQVSNGEEVAVSLGKDLKPELAFKITYQWK